MQGYVPHVISAAGEYLLAFCFMGYFISLVPEFKKLSLAPLKLIDRQTKCTDIVVVPVSDLCVRDRSNASDENDSAVSTV